MSYAICHSNKMGVGGGFETFCDVIPRMALEPQPSVYINNLNVGKVK